MRRRIRKAEWLLAAMMLGNVLVLTGCEEGPVEDAGEEVDDALDDAGDELE